MTFLCKVNRGSLRLTRQEFVGSKPPRRQSSEFVDLEEAAQCLPAVGDVVRLARDGARARVTTRTLATGTIMSFASLATVLGHFAMFGIARESDEGAAAHIFPLLMISQLPIMAYFAFNGLRRSPRQTPAVLALLAGTAVAALSPVFALGL